MSAVDQLEAAGEVLSPAVRAVIAALAARIREVEARRVQDSTHSSRPPSADPPGVVRAATPPSGRARGDAPGHHARGRLRAEPGRAHARGDHRGRDDCFPTELHDVRLQRVK